MTLQSAYAVQHGTTVLTGLRGIDSQINPEVDNEVKIGSPYPQFAVVRSEKPRIVFSTDSIATTLALVGLTGVDIDASNNLVANFAALANGLVDGAGTHQSYTADRGLLYARRLTCEHGQDAVLDCEALLYSSDGATSPITIGTAALPTLVVNNVRHTLDTSITLAGVAMGCVRRVELDFGNSLRSLGCNSDVWDSHLEQPGIAPVLTITGIDPTKFAAANIPMGGKAATHANSIVYLRKRDTSGIGFVSDITAEHIKIDASGVVNVTGHSGKGPAASELTVQLTCSLDASLNAPVAFDTASAIS